MTLFKICVIVFLWPFSYLFLLSPICSFKELRASAYFFEDVPQLLHRYGLFVKPQCGQHLCGIPFLKVFRQDDLSSSIRYISSFRCHPLSSGCVIEISCAGQKLENGPVYIILRLFGASVYV